MPGLFQLLLQLLLLLQLQFWQIQAALPGIEGARVVAVAVAVLEDLGCSGEEGEFWLEKWHLQVTQVQFQQAQLVLAGIGCTRVVAVAVAVAVWTD